MRDFFASRRWDPPGPWLHVLAVVEQQPGAATVAELAGRYRDALAPVLDVQRPALAPVPTTWLHWTVAKLVPTAAVPGAVYDELIARLVDCCARIEPVRVQVGPAVIGRSNLRFALYPEPPLQAIQTAVTDISAAVLTPVTGRALEPPAVLPHITIAYAIRDDPDADIHTVNDVPGRAALVVRQLTVVDHLQDVSSGGYRWSVRHTLDLAPPTSGVQS